MQHKLSKELKNTTHNLWRFDKLCKKFEISQIGHRKQFVSFFGKLQRKVGVDLNWDNELRLFFSLHFFSFLFCLFNLQLVVRVIYINMTSDSPRLFNATSPSKKFATSLNATGTKKRKIN